jgi:hypothetical protein
MVGAVEIQQMLSDMHNNPILKIDGVKTETL